MLFPTDPNARAGLWDRFEEKLRLDGVKFIIMNGRSVPEGDRDVVCKDAEGSIFLRFRSADMVRVGSSRGQASVGQRGMFTPNGDSLDGWKPWW